jgi:hypothetical protein
MANSCRIDTISAPVPKGFAASTRQLITLRGTGFGIGKFPHVDVIDMSEFLEKTITWNIHHDTVTSDGTVLTFEATPEGKATRGNGELTVTVSNDGRDKYQCKNETKFKVYYYNPSDQPPATGDPVVYAVAPENIELDRDDPYTLVLFGENFKIRLFWIFYIRRPGLRVTLDAGGGNVEWGCDKKVPVVNWDGTKMWLKDLKPCGKPTHGSGELNVTVSNDGHRPGPKFRFICNYIKKYPPKTA